MKICNTCKVDKPLEDFHWKSKAKGTRSGRCKACTKDYCATHYLENRDLYIERAKTNGAVSKARNKQWLKEYLLANPCACGESDIEVLQFDHDPPLMDGTANRVAYFMKHSLETLQNEVGKCVVRCANCHYRLTRKQMGWSWD